MTSGVTSSSRPIRQLGRYALYSEIASGGMATVYLGRQRGQAGFVRTVAIKCLHPHLAKDPEFVAMFTDEAHLAARIRHPNVVPTLDVGATDGELFLVMEYVHGESLGRLLRMARLRNQTVPPRILASIITDVLHGLHAAHEATSASGEPLGLVHRDVSPANLLVGADGVTRIVDFGVAKAAGRLQTTREGQLKGKIAYMAPEQVVGSSSRRSDVYAATIVLWEALTDRRLFKGENDASVMNQVINSMVDPPSYYNHKLDTAWDEIVLKGLERIETDRWPTARDMAIEMEKRLPMARASDVGAWVDSLSHDSLAKRAAEASAIARVWDVELAEPEQAVAGPARTTLPTIPEHPAPHTRESSAYVSSPPSEPPSPIRRRRMPVAWLSVGAAILAAWAIVVTRSATTTSALPVPAVATPSVVASTAAPRPSSSQMVPGVSADIATPPPMTTAARSRGQPAIRTHPKVDASPTTPTTKEQTIGSVLDTRY